MKGFRLDLHDPHARRSLANSPLTVKVSTRHSTGRNPSAKLTPTWETTRRPMSFFYERSGLQLLFQLLSALCVAELAVGSARDDPRRNFGAASQLCSDRVVVAVKFTNASELHLSEIRRQNLLTCSFRAGLAFCGFFCFAKPGRPIKGELLSLVPTLSLLVVGGRMAGPRGSTPSVVLNALARF